MPNNETITPAQSSQEGSVTSTQSQEPALDPRLAEIQREEQAQPDYSIPEKFRGKSLQDVAKSYTEIEKHVGRLGSEKAHAEKELQEARARLAALEQERQALYAQQSARPAQENAPQEQDPLQSFDQEFNQDPSEAVKKAVKSLAQETRRTREQISQELSARQANEFYQRQLKENPDFAAVNPDMQQLAMKYGRMLKPEHVNTPETIELLYQLARAQHIGRYIDDAVKKAKSASDMVTAEKRQAYSESSGATGSSGRVNPEDMDVDELARLLGRK